VNIRRAFTVLLILAAALVVTKAMTTDQTMPDAPHGAPAFRGIGAVGHTMTPRPQPTRATRSEHRRPIRHHSASKPAPIRYHSAAPTLAPAPAPVRTSAYSPLPWDRVAQCESGGDWHINTGNGFYGGLQFTATSWGSGQVGGLLFAPRADLATRDQQIIAADRLYRVQGRGAWPICGLVLP
jgi:hypothetical protein